MLERQREGTKAKGEGRYKGRAPTARAKSAELMALAKQGVAKEKIAKQVGVGVASVCRVMQAAPAGRFSRIRSVATLSLFGTAAIVALQYPLVGLTICICCLILYLKP